MTVQTEARNATLDDLARILTEQQDAKLDFVAPATTIRSRGGMIHVKDADVSLSEDGVTTRDGLFRPTAIFDEGVADKLGIPLKYVRTLRAERPDLYDANVNGWLHGRSVVRRMSVGVAEDGSPIPGDVPEVVAPADPRSFLVRAFRGTEDGEPGVARALLSDGYGGVADNLDALTAVLDGARQSGTEIGIESCDLSDRRMTVKITAPQIREVAPDLLRGYRSPFGSEGVNRAGWTLERARAAAGGEGLGYTPGSEPIVWAGLVVSNSETGDGAFLIVPRLFVEACRNGLRIQVDALRSIHLGGKLDAGVVKWTADTQRKNLDLITAKARDAVSSFLDVEYLRKTIARLTESAVTPISEVEATIQVVAKKLAFSESERAGILSHFILGGQMTAGGIMQAVTSFCQTVEDADAANDLEAKAVDAMLVAARL